jgi:hypothetical protein
MLSASCFVLALVLCTSAWSTAHAAPRVREAAKTAAYVGRALFWGGMAVREWCWNIKACHPYMYDPKSDRTD